MNVQSGTKTKINSQHRLPACIVTRMNAAKGGARIMLLFLLAILVTEGSGLTPQCRNEKGEPVDW